jgi:succinate-acetate transporter protein
MRDKTWVACLLCLAGTVTVGLADLVASEVQVAVALLLLFGGSLGFIAGRWAWVWGLVLGCSVFCAHALAAVCGYQPPYLVQPNLLVTFLAMIPALLGSFVGAGLNWAIRKSCAAT